MAIKQKTGPIVASDVAQIGDDSRLLCPATIRSLVPWLTAHGRQTVIAELAAPGYVVLRPAAAMEEPLAEYRASLSEGDETLEKLGVLEDRYRLITVQKDGRIRLTPVVLVYLGVEPGTRPYLFVQVSAEQVEIMSLTFRNELLAKLKSETSI